MTKIISNPRIKKFGIKKRRGVAEVISTLLLVVITVVGAVILTTFIDESFVSGSLSVSSGTDTTLKTVRLWGYDTRDGSGLMGYTLANNSTNLMLCRNSCTNDNANPALGGSEFLVIQVQNRGISPLYLKNVYLDNINHFWDSDTASEPLNSGAPDSSGGGYPSDGMFSILSSEIGDTVQRPDNQIQGGETVNLLFKLDNENPDIALSKTIRVQLNVGANTLPEFLIESGDAQ